MEPKPKVPPTSTFPKDEVRQASHAGTWYSRNRVELDKQLESWLNTVKQDFKEVTQVKALIGPHAGFCYSGPTLAWGYKYVQPRKSVRVFLLGPCHYVHLKISGISTLREYETPIGGLELDTEVINNLLELVDADTKKPLFIRTDKDTEEEEHSLEMHLPYIRKVFAG
jgi:MEMO1 family protein